MLRDFIKVCPFFNEFTLVTVNLDENEAIKIYDYDEIDNNPSPKPYYLT